MTALSARWFAGLIVTGFLCPCLAAAAETSVEANYKIYFASFPLANAALQLDMNNTDYVAHVRMWPTGLGTIVSAARTAVAAAGTIERGRVVPRRYSVDGKDYERGVRVRMALQRGNVTQLEADPPLSDAPDRIPVTNRHRSGIVDPLSSGLMPYRGGAVGPAACERTLEIFDGWTRYDVKLSYRRTEEVTVGSYSGPAVVCGARWRPISGHRPNREAVKYLEANTGLEVSVIPLPGADVLIPYKVSLQTRNGTLSVAAETMEIHSSKLASAEPRGD